jgi:hypothetical protein
MCWNRGPFFFFSKVSGRRTLGQGLFLCDRNLCNHSFAVFSAKWQSIWQSPAFKEEVESGCYHSTKGAEVQVWTRVSVVKLGSNNSTVSTSWDIAITWRNHIVNTQFGGARLIPDHHHPNIRCRLENRLWFCLFCFSDSGFLIYTSNLTLLISHTSEFEKERKRKYKCPLCSQLLQPHLLYSKIFLVQHRDTQDWFVHFGSW